MFLRGAEVGLAIVRSCYQKNTHGVWPVGLVLVGMGLVMGWSRTILIFVSLFHGRLGSTPKRSKTEGKVDIRVIVHGSEQIQFALTDPTLGSIWIQIGTDWVVLPRIGVGSGMATDWIRPEADLIWILFASSWIGFGREWIGFACWGTLGGGKGL